jgi:hypothetical protein
MTDQEILEAMVKFMKQTNEILQRFGIEINNIKVDVDKLKKHQVNNRIDLIGKDYKIK